MTLPIQGFLKSNGYFWLSNFYPTNVVVEGLEFQSSEAAYMAQKCALFADKKQFTTISNPAEAKKLGRRVQLRNDWDYYRVLAMTKVVYAKFDQNIDLAIKLLGTKDAYLEETNSWGDKFWGVDDVTGEGLNMLGNILMYTREILVAPTPD